MRLEKIHLPHIFNPDNLVETDEIFSNQHQTIDTTDGKQEQKKFEDKGLFSKRIFGDIDSLNDYSCDCGNISGKFYEGTICQKCNSEVKFVGQNIERYGWIDLSMGTYKDGIKTSQDKAAFHLIKYVSYYFIEKIFGRENLRNIIHASPLINVAGNPDFDEIEAKRTSDPKCKYWYYGIDQFYNHYNEILDYYYELNGQKETDIYNEYKDRDDVFTDKIPVVSIVLRPAMRTADGLKLDEINIKYQSILKYIKQLKNPAAKGTIQRDNKLELIQSEYNLLSEKIIAAIKSKAGIIRNSICGTRINFSARNIISPANKENKMTEISVPYQTFLELYKFEIIKIISDTENKSLKDAENEWYEATLEYNEKIWMIMNKIVHEHEVGCLLNRNPTIALGSILYVTIKDVKKDFNDATMSLSNLLLSLLAGDYDGDVLNLVSIKDKSTRELFKLVFSPVNLIINPSDGNFNNSLNLERDQILGLNSLLI